ncbi:MAG: ATP synthase F0 subunit B [Deltaproteobacteria bacterium]|nr:ATP synthase F0 subunit B [Deltaproteobacteria bacterium]
MEHLEPINPIKIFNFGALHLELNTPVFIFILVVIVLVLMNWLLIKPVMRTIHHRNQYMKDVRLNTERNTAEIVKLRETYQEKLNRVKAEIAVARMDARRKSHAVVDDTLSKAKKESEAEMKKGLDDLDRQVSAVRQELLGQSKNLADMLSERVLK